MLGLQHSLTKSLLGPWPYIIESQNGGSSSLPISYCFRLKTVSRQFITFKTITFNFDGKEMLDLNPLLLLHMLLPVFCSAMSGVDIFQSF